MPNNAQKPVNRATKTAVFVDRFMSARREPKGRVAISVKAVSLYASHTQTQSHHQLPHGNFQVRNGIYSCIAVRSASCAKRGCRTAGA